jgi:hypothetical protein
MTAGLTSELATVSFHTLHLTLRAADYTNLLLLPPPLLLLLLLPIAIPPARHVPAQGHQPHPRQGAC